ncbi:MAG TPA: thioredoxin domain-containing protein [Gemmatimonadaceae bacterium]|nr:thioredoxin domain-containing protein [Gemmatimonadaceae bacterium]
MRLTIAALLAAVLPLAACGASNGASTSGESASAIVSSSHDSLPAVGDTALERRADLARIKGNDDAPLWIVEVSDFQCPYCRAWHEETYPDVMKEFIETGKARLAYINFPIPGHKNAWPAAEAAMCAAAQGHFWPMHDALFQTQRQWESLQDPSAVFDSLATTVGVDAGPYHDCVTQHEMRPLIQADIDRARESGVNATPTFIIGDQAISGAQPIQAFRQIIGEQLKKSGQGS